MVIFVHFGYVLGLELGVRGVKSQGEGSDIGDSRRGVGVCKCGAGG